MSKENQVPWYGTASQVFRDVVTTFSRVHPEKCVDVDRVCSLVSEQELNMIPKSMSFIDLIVVKIRESQTLGNKGTA
jgi:hypothetical protein